MAAGSSSVSFSRRAASAATVASMLAEPGDEWVSEKAELAPLR